MSRFIEKFRNLGKAFKHNGGLRQSYLQYFRTDDLKWGTLVGEDKFGSKYYENNHYFVGRNRWVKYSDQFGMDYDGSQVPPEWHRWLQNITDDPPTSKPPVLRKWMIDHRQNFSGTNQHYVPYSTTRPKIEAWQPSPKSN